MQTPPAAPAEVYPHPAPDSRRETPACPTAGTQKTRQARECGDLPRQSQTHRSILLARPAAPEPPMAVRRPPWASLIETARRLKPSADNRTDVRFARLVHAIGATAPTRTARHARSS